jgi:predicted phage tail protein
VLREGHFRVIKAREHVSDTLDIDEMKLRLGRAREIHVVPIVAGSASGWGKILTGVAIIGLAIAAPYALGMATSISGAMSATAFAGISYGQIAGFGALIALSGVSQMLSPTPAAAGSTMDSFLFGSLQNVTTQGGPVPLVFGEFITGSVVISSGLSTEDFSAARFTYSGTPASPVVVYVNDVSGIVLLNPSISI